MALLGCRNDPGRAGERAVEAREPFVAAVDHAGADEVLPVEGQDDVHLRARGERAFDDDEIGAAGGGAIEDRAVEPCDPRADRVLDRGDQRGRKPRHGAARRIDHVAGERDDVGCAHDVEHRRGVRKNAREQQQLPAHRRDASDVVCGQRLRGRVVPPRIVPLPQQQRRFAGGCVIPERARRSLCRDARADLLREGSRLCAIAQQQGERRRVDSRDKDRAAATRPRRIRRGHARLPRPHPAHRAFGAAGPSTGDRAGSGCPRAVAATPVPRPARDRATHALRASRRSARARARRNRGARDGRVGDDCAARNASQASQGAPCARSTADAVTYSRVLVCGRGIERAKRRGVPFAMSGASDASPIPSAGGRPAVGVVLPLASTGPVPSPASLFLGDEAASQRRAFQLPHRRRKPVDDPGGFLELPGPLRLRRRERGRVQRPGDLEVLAEIVVAARVEARDGISAPDR